MLLEGEEVLVAGGIDHESAGKNVGREADGGGGARTGGLRGGSAAGVDGCAD